MKFFRSAEKVWRSASKFTGDRKIRKVLHLRGKNFQSLFNGLRPASSAGSVSSFSSDPYGPTGSIVGRY